MNNNKEIFFTKDIKIKRALISVTDKRDLEKIAKVLVKNKIEILSTGGTAEYLKQNSIPVKEVSDQTNFPEILDGRVKTLNPKIHGGILFRRDDPSHLEQIQKHDIYEINLLIINLYKFRETLHKTSKNRDIIENIDIGGPAMIRAGAKNHEFVTVVTDPNDYPEFISQIDNNGKIKYSYRKYLAAKAFRLTNEYDNAISDWLEDKEIISSTFPENLSINLNKSYEMRYGENPHQKAALYKTSDKRKGITNSKKLQGKELSYNNVNDADAAFELICEFKKPAVAIIKHANPCGVAENDDLNSAWEKALQTDPVSAFGGIVSINRELTKDLALKMKSLFLEVIIAPSVDREALKIFADKPNVRILATGSLASPEDTGLLFKSISGGMLVQSRDYKVLNNDNIKIVTKRKPTNKEIDDLLFAWKVAKHTKSNAIVYAKNLQTVGIGAGQMSRIDSTSIANEKAKKASYLAKLETSMTYKSVVASDAFFPFADGLIAAANAGVTAVIQPGGSIRDKKVIEAADERNIAMIFTSIRHFRH